MQIREFYSVLYILFISDKIRYLLKESVMTRDEIDRLIKVGFSRSKAKIINGGEKIVIRNFHFIRKECGNYIVKQISKSGEIMFTFNTLNEFIRCFDEHIPHITEEFFNIFKIVEDNDFNELIQLARIKKSHLYMYSLEHSEFQYIRSISDSWAVNYLQEVITHEVPFIVNINRRHKAEIEVKAHMVNGKYKLEIPIQTINDESLEKIKIYNLLKNI